MMRFLLAALFIVALYLTVLPFAVGHSLAAASQPAASDR
jgi:hypothetical protein